MTGRRTLIGYFLRHSGNLHYFAAIKPYLDHFMRVAGVENRIIVARPPSGQETPPEIADYARLFAADLRVDDCDVVLTPSFLRPEDRPGPRNPATRVVQIFHGMSDKPFTYERDFGDYALCLCAGRRQIDRLLAHERNRGIRWAMVGYPKFDRFPTAPPLFTDGRKTLVYCPTWRKGGISSVERFLDGPAAVADLAHRHNLIVKPHPNIFNPDRPHFDRSVVERLERLERVPGVRLVRSGNVMPWFAQADLFIGDISAAGYEWLYFNRPMVFLNPRPAELRATADPYGLTYLWRCGEVCDEVGRLGAAVEAALTEDRHAAVREATLHYSVHHPRDGRALDRGAAAIQALLHAGEVRAPEEAQQHA
ncbi:glycerophosphotransferase [Craurococcus roseus]|uniref:Glycerophosphotransferase n=1 Tax=Craurococcus roseus TaxID=77585 RepID=A0ABP3R4W2_9PROT